MAKPKIKVHWRGKPGSVKHAVREVDGTHQDRAVCGARIGASFNAAGERRKPSDSQCQKCLRWEPIGYGPGGSVYEARRKVPA